jgi:hypothetical protein
MQRREDRHQRWLLHFEIMRKVFIVSAHFPPSNLAGVHRARLIANHLSAEGWKPTVLAVDPKYYEERLERDLVKLVDPSVEVRHVKAIPQKIARPLGWGDLGIRGWLFLYQALGRAARGKEIDLLHITIPSNYQSLLGRVLWNKFKIPYIIDYIDPWIHESNLGEPCLSKGWISQKLAYLCEPIAVSKASGIMGITEGYIDGVFRRNPSIKNTPRLAVQYGGSKKDHDLALMADMPVRRLEVNSQEKQIVYAGALLPKAIEPMRAFFNALRKVNSTTRKQNPIRLICIGTGSSPHDAHGYQVLPIAKSVGAEKWLSEYPERHPYLEVLKTLAKADGILIVGSTEPHYSPSKVFQSIMAERPVLALLHESSDTVEILKRSRAGEIVSFSSEFNSDEVEASCLQMVQRWPDFQSTTIDRDYLKQFDVTANAKKIVRFYEQVVGFNEIKNPNN